MGAVGCWRIIGVSKRGFSKNENLGKLRLCGLNPATSIPRIPKSFDLEALDRLFSQKACG